MHALLANLSISSSNSIVLTNRTDSNFSLLEVNRRVNNRKVNNRRVNNRRVNNRRTSQERASQQRVNPMTVMRQSTIMKGKCVDFDLIYCFLSQANFSYCSNEAHNSSVICQVETEPRQLSITAATKRKRRHKGPEDELETSIVERLNSLDSKRAHVDSDEDGLFGRQIAATLRRFPYEKKAFAKLRLQQVMLEVELGGSGDGFSLFRESTPSVTNHACVHHCVVSCDTWPATTLCVVYKPAF